MLILRLNLQGRTTGSANEGLSNVALIGVVQRPVRGTDDLNQGAPPRASRRDDITHVKMAMQGRGNWGVGGVKVGV